MAWKGVITNGGSELLAQWTAGKVLTITRAAAGTGRVSEAAMLAQTALVSEKQTVSILSNKTTAQGQKLQLQVTPLATGYPLNQLGIWAKLDSGAARLIALFQTDTDAGVEIPSKTDVPDYVYTFYGLLEFTGSSGTLQVTIDASALVTAESMAAAIKNHNEDKNAHEALFAAARSADEYDAGKTYAAGDYCQRDGTLYRCTTATAGEAWDASHWAATTLAAELQALYAAVAGCAPLTHAARHAAGGADAITPASIGAAAASHTHTPESIGAAATKTLTCTVPVSWTASGSYYSQTVAVPGMLESDNPVADILPGTDNDANKLYAEAWGKVQSIDTLDGAVKLWCTSKPGTAFPVQFLIVR